MKRRVRNKDPAVKSWKIPSLLIAASARCFLSSRALPGLLQLGTVSIWDVSSFCHTSHGLPPGPTELQTSPSLSLFPVFPAQTCFWFCNDSLPVLILLCSIIVGLSPVKLK